MDRYKDALDKDVAHMQLALAHVKGLFHCINRYKEIFCKDLDLMHSALDHLESMMENPDLYNMEFFEKYPIGSWPWDKNPEDDSGGSGNNSGGGNGRTQC